ECLACCPGLHIDYALSAAFRFRSRPLLHGQAESCCSQKAGASRPATHFLLKAAPLPFSVRPQLAFVGRRFVFATRRPFAPVRPELSEFPLRAVVCAQTPIPRRLRMREAR